MCRESSQWVGYGFYFIDNFRNYHMRWKMGVNIQLSMHCCRFSDKHLQSPPLTTMSLWHKSVNYGDHLYWNQQIIDHGSSAWAWALYYRILHRTVLHRLTDAGVIYLCRVWYSHRWLHCSLRRSFILWGGFLVQMSIQGCATEMGRKISLLV